VMEAINVPGVEPSVRMASDPSFAFTGELLNTTIIMCFVWLNKFLVVLILVTFAVLSSKISVECHDFSIGELKPVRYIETIEIIE
jgi:hypothetical protein